jgi:hypothetical protein
MDKQKALANPQQDLVLQLHDVVVTSDPTTSSRNEAAASSEVPQTTMMIITPSVIIKSNQILEWIGSSSDDDDNDNDIENDVDVKDNRYNGKRKKEAAQTTTTSARKSSECQPTTYTTNNEKVGDNVVAVVGTNHDDSTEKSPSAKEDEEEDRHVQSPSVTQSLLMRPSVILKSNQILEWIGGSSSDEEDNGTDVDDVTDRYTGNKSTSTPTILKGLKKEAAQSTIATTPRNISEYMDPNCNPSKQNGDGDVGLVGYSGEEPQDKIHKANYDDDDDDSIEKHSTTTTRPTMPHGCSPGAFSIQPQGAHHQETLSSSSLDGVRNAARIHSSSDGSSIDLEQQVVGRQSNNSNSDDKDTVTLEAMLIVEDVDRRRLEQQIREEYLSSAVTGQVTTVPSHHQRKRTTRTILLSLVTILVLGSGIVVGIMKGTQRRVVPVLRPSTTTNNNTTLPPTMTFLPSSDDEGAPITHSPSSFPPSMSPSRSITNLQNGNVSEPHPLILHSTVLPLVYRLSNAGVSDVVVECGSVSAGNQISLWYSYQPRISGPVSVIVCSQTSGYSFAAAASVEVRPLVGDYPGNQLTCPVTRFDPGKEDMGNTTTDCGSGNGSTISWAAEMGSIYYVSVSPLSFTNSNNYTMTGNESDTNDDDDDDVDEFTIQLVDNDQCNHAAGPIRPTSAGIVISYTTTYAKVEKKNNQEAIIIAPCGGASSATTSPGVWYKVQGTGSALTASTCSDDTTLDTQLSVFQGDCGNLVCVNGNNDFCGTQSTVVWPSVFNESYLVLVHGLNGTTGAFHLTLSTDRPRKENDFCISATPLRIGDNVTFDLSGSSADPDLRQCVNDPVPPVLYYTPTSGTIVVEEFPHGIWYSIVGTGLQNISVSIAHTEGIPLNRNIYSGNNSCGDLSCVDHIRSESACDGGLGDYTCTEFLCIPATKGEVYYVFVSTSSLEFVNEEHALMIDSC